MIDQLETQRLIISKISSEDADFMLKLLNSPDWLQFIGDRKIKTIEQAIEYIHNHIFSSYSDLGFGFYKLQLKLNKEKIGICGLIKREYLEDIDIGFALLPDFYGKAYGLEAALTVMNKAEKKLKLKRLAAIVQPNNTKSINLLKKLGMIKIKNIPDHLDKDKELFYFVKKFNDPNN